MQGRPQIHGRGFRVLAPGYGLLLAHGASRVAPLAGGRFYAVDRVGTGRCDSGSDRYNPVTIPGTSALPNERCKGNKTKKKRKKKKQDGKTISL